VVILLVFETHSTSELAAADFAWQEGWEYRLD